MGPMMMVNHFLSSLPILSRCDKVRIITFMIYGWKNYNLSKVTVSKHEDVENNLKYFDRYRNDARSTIFNSMFYQRNQLSFENNSYVIQ